MAVVYIPSLMRPLTNGQERLDVTGATVRQIIQELDRQFPGIQARLCQGDELQPGLAVAVDGHLSTRGLSHKLQPTSEVHFLPAISGG